MEFQTYGSVFIWGPAVALFVIGYLANRRTWRLTTGLCHRTQPLFKGGKRIIHFIYVFASVGVKAFIAPATWVVLAFLKGEYYACAHWPDPNVDIGESRKFYQLDDLRSNVSLPKPCMYSPDPAEFNSNAEADVIARTLRAESHIIAWFYLTLGMIVSVVLMFFMRCQSKFSYEQSNYIARYREHEINLFEEQLDEKAKIQAERIVNGYFSKTRSKEDWDKIAVINDKVTRSKKGKAIYSPLHRFVNKEKFSVDRDSANEDLVQHAFVKSKHFFKSAKHGPRGVSSQSKNVNSIISVPEILPLVVSPTQKENVKTNKISEFQDQDNAPQSVTSPSNQSNSQLSSEKVMLFEQPSNKLVKTCTIMTTTTAQKLSATSKIQATATQPLTTRSQNLSSPSSALLQPKIVRSLSLPPSGSLFLSEKHLPPKETSCGDFGGCYSRENLCKIESVDDVNSTFFSEQCDLSDSDISNQTQEDKEHISLLKR